MKKVFIDLEVIFNLAQKMTANIINQVEYKASDQFSQRISELYDSQSIDDEEYRELLNTYQDYKDRIFEEVDEKYQGLIPYQKIYSIKYVDKSIYDLIMKFSRDPNLDIYIVFYYNTERERVSKMQIKTMFPNTKIVGLNYYSSPYNPNIKRKRTNIAKEIIKKYNLNGLENCLLISRSSINCSNWTNEFGEAVNYKSENLETINSSSNKKIDR